MITVYGIKNCDTMKKAFTHLDKNGVEYSFFDFKKETPKLADIKRWKKQLGDWPVNKRGTTFRKIKDAFENGSDSEKASLILDNLSAIKRPLVEDNKEVVALGYDKESFDKLS